MFPIATATVKARYMCFHFECATPKKHTGAAWIPSDMIPSNAEMGRSRNAMPRADMPPPVLVEFSPVPGNTNPLGAKGAGDGGTVAATPAIMNAILDAVVPFGVSNPPMPAIPERIWRAPRDRDDGAVRPRSGDR